MVPFEQLLQQNAHLQQAAWRRNKDVQGGDPDLFCLVRRGFCSRTVGKICMPHCGKYNLRVAIRVEILSSRQLQWEQEIVSPQSYYNGQQTIAIEILSEKSWKPIEEQHNMGDPTALRQIHSMGLVPRNKLDLCKSSGAPQRENKRKNNYILSHNCDFSCLSLIKSTPQLFPPITSPAESLCLHPTLRSTSKIWLGLSLGGALGPDP